MADTLNHQNQHPKPSLVQTINLISAQGLNDDIPLDNSQIHHFRKIFEEAFYKGVIIPEIGDLDRHNRNPVENILDIIDRYRSSLQTTKVKLTSNVQQLAWDYFFNFQTDPFFARHFLFGTPSQKRF